MKLIKIIKRGGCHINRSKIRSQGNHTILIFSSSYVLCVYLSLSMSHHSVSLLVFVCWCLGVSVSCVYFFRWMKRSSQGKVTIVSLLSLVLKFSVYVPVFSPFLCLCVCVSVVVSVLCVLVSLCRVFTFSGG